MPTEKSQEINRTKSNRDWLSEPSWKFVFDKSAKSKLKESTTPEDSKKSCRSAFLLSKRPEK